MRYNEDQTNQYDKIFRENMEVALPGIIRNLLGNDIVSSEEIPDDIQHTKERKPDLLKKIKDGDGKVFILHIEYQVKDENEMVYRMAEYKVMLLRKYKLAVKQFVLFMGRGSPRMPTEINEADLQYRYRLTALSEVDYRVFLRSDKPEEKILGILANFEDDGAELALKNILIGVQASSAGDFAQSRYFKQLRILAQLRNLDIKFMEAMKSITKYFKEERDPLYRRGEAKGKAEGIEKNQELMIRNLIEQLNLSDEQIAGIAEVSVDFVKMIRIRIKK